MKIGRAPSVYTTGGPEKCLMIDKKMPGPRQGPFSPAADHASTRDGGEDAARTRKRAANVKDHIGRQLRALYDEVASQPVPDRFMELLNRLDVKSGEE
jgi:Anti-sigma factor NepR